MLILAYDTETTGLVRGTDYTNPNNPYLAAVAMVLYDTDAHRIIASFNTAILPEGWTMPADAAAVNGLSDEYLTAVGIPARVAVPTILTIAAKAELLVAHNAEFDRKIIAAALWRYLISEEPENTNHAVVEHWLNIPTFCTMKESKSVVGALTVNGKLKSPKLIEAYKHFFGRELDRAHSANADTVAVLEIYLALQENSK